eukprot:TRINITY_DN11251_c2_g2_i1.p1 TRINITY_DN11251_c2_g2~~TRINITY_DN11251_c2_g2_i1.p1  ORF type:complete len:191 (+),score=-13.48 TRINITY_DN11251_c2_g2_i1:734-1306(+)
MLQNLSQLKIVKNVYSICYPIYCFISIQVISSKLNIFARVQMDKSCKCKHIIRKRQLFELSIACINLDISHIFQAKTTMLKIALIHRAFHISNFLPGNYTGELQQQTIPTVQNITKIKKYKPTRLEPLKNENILQYFPNLLPTDEVKYIVTIQFSLFKSKLYCFQRILNSHFLLTKIQYFRTQATRKQVK